VKDLELEFEKIGSVAEMEITSEIVHLKAILVIH
jgi:hypothetical protein